MTKVVASMDIMHCGQNVYEPVWKQSYWAISNNSTSKIVFHSTILHYSVNILAPTFTIKIKYLNFLQQRHLFSNNVLTDKHPFIHKRHLHTLRTMDETATFNFKKTLSLSYKLCAAVYNIKINWHEEMYPRNFLHLHKLL